MSERGGSGAPDGEMRNVNSSKSAESVNIDFYNNVEGIKVDNRTPKERIYDNSDEKGSAQTETILDVTRNSEKPKNPLEKGLYVGDSFVVSANDGSRRRYDILPPEEAEEAAPRDPILKMTILDKEGNEVDRGLRSVAEKSLDSMLEMLQSKDGSVELVRSGEERLALEAEERSKEHDRLVGLYDDVESVKPNATSDGSIESGEGEDPLELTDQSGIGENGPMSDMLKQAAAEDSERRAGTEDAGAEEPATGSEDQDRSPEGQLVPLVDLGEGNVEAPGTDSSDSLDEALNDFEKKHLRGDQEQSQSPEGQLVPLIDLGEDTDTKDKDDSENENNPESKEDKEVREKVEKLFEARDKYAELTANDRTRFLGRFFQKDSLLTRLVNKMPFGEQFVGFINNTKASREMTEAKASYNDSLKGVLESLVATMEAGEKSAEEIHEVKIAAWLQEKKNLQAKIVEEQMKLGKDKKANKFTNWWVRHNGVGGKIMKAGVVITASALTGGAAGAVFGLAGAVAAAGWAGAVVGASTGFGIAKHVTDRRAQSFADKNKTETVSQRESKEDIAKFEGQASNMSTERMKTSALVNALVGSVEDRTNEVVGNNRRRIVTSTLLGKAAGTFAGAWAGNFLGGPDVQTVTKRTPSDRDFRPRPETPPPTPPEQLITTFDVEPGSGLINEWSQWASANGHPIDTSTAEQLHGAIIDRFGADGVTKDIGTYIGDSNVGIGIDRPGLTELQDGVADFAKQWLQSNGKW